MWSRSRRWAGQEARALFESAKGFEEAQGDIPLPGVLADQQRQLLPEHRQAEGPVGEQQDHASLAAAQPHTH